MPEPAGTTTLKELLFETLESFEELLVLECVNDRNDASDCKVDQVARAAGLSIETAEMGLRSLLARGIVRSPAGEPDRFIYQPSSSQREALDRIMLEYRTNPAQVIGLMTANAIERVRTAGLRTFAECFRIRGPRR